SALFLKSFHRAQQIDPGFRTQNLAIVSVDPALAGYDQKRGGQIARDILEQVRRDPQVRSADLGQFVPLGFGGEGRTIVAEGRDGKSATCGDTPTPMLYTPCREAPDGGITIFVHTVGAPGPMLPEVHRIVRNIDNHIFITYEKTVTQHLAFALWPSWMGAILL